jgi:apolipoprotein N-acyltransferase
MMFFINYIYGLNKINNDKYSFDKNISIKIVSPNFTLKDYKLKSEMKQLMRLIKISNPDENKKTLFIWPEGIFYESYLEDIIRYKKLFKENFSESHLIALGITSSAESSSSSDKKYFNSLVILNNKLDVLALYKKINLVPLGEFLPYENFLSRLGLKKITQGYNSFSSGSKREIINLGNTFNGKLILPLICYEIIYSGDIKKSNQLPDLVVNISEDAWFGKSIGPHQHFAKAIYRAVEEGVFIARSANKGVSAIIDPNGQVIKSLNTGESGNIELNFPNYYKSNLFSNYGNKIFFLIIFLYILLILIFRKLKI